MHENFIFGKIISYRRNYSVEFKHGRSQGEEHTYTHYAIPRNFDKFITYWLTHNFLFFMYILCGNLSGK